MANYCENYTFPCTVNNFSLNMAGVPVNSVTATTYSTIAIGGVSYTLYNLTSNSVDLRTGAFAILNNGDVYYMGSISYTPAIGTEITNTNLAIYKRTSMTNDMPVRTFVKFVVRGWIKKSYQNQDYYYLMAKEEEQFIYSETFSNATVLDDYEPYEPIQETLEVTRTLSKKIYDSVSMRTGTSTDTASKTIDTYKTSVGTQALDSVTFSNPSSSYSWNVTITAWDSVSYEIVAKTNKTIPLIYTGKVVGNDFLTKYRIKRTRSNEYKTLEDYPKSSLELSKMSKTIMSESDTAFTFNYDISDFTETATTSISFTIPSMLIHKLASGNNKFKNFVRQKAFENNDVVGNFDFASAGSLTYDDDTTISLNDLTITSSSMTSSLGELPQTIGINTPSAFTITYTMTLPYFGTLSLTDSCTVGSSIQVDHVVLANALTTFYPNDVIKISATSGTLATLTLYNSNNEVLGIITGSDIDGVATNKSVAYGKYARDYLQDEIMTLSFDVYDCSVEQNIVFIYDELQLGLDTSDIETLAYYIDDDFEDFDYSDVVVTATRHTNSIVNNEIDTEITTRDVSNSAIFSHDEVNIEDEEDYRIFVSYTNEYAQTLTNYFDIHAIKTKAQGIEASGTSSYTNYWSSGGVFKIPTGLTFTVYYNKVGESDIVDISDLTFFRDVNHNVPLTADTTVITPNGDNHIYFHSETYNLDGRYDITFTTDSIASVDFKTKVNIYLGNRLNIPSITSQVVLVCTHLSGTNEEISDTTRYNFKNNSIITTAQSSLVVIIDGTEYTITVTNSNVDWKIPYGKLEFDFSNFPTQYNNSVDTIYPNTIGAKMTYYEDNLFTTKCEYECPLTYSSSTTDSYLLFTVAGNGVLETALGTTLNIDMNGSNVVSSSVTVSSKNQFDTSTSVSGDIAVEIYEITNIFGIKVLNAKTEYHVGQSFLDTDDDTELLIYYKNTSNQERTYRCLLRNSPTVLNIYPAKGTVFNKSVLNKDINITCVTNSDVYANYSIDVTYNYIYSEEKKHTLVAVYIANYRCPDGLSRSKYYLVENEQVTIDGKVVWLTTETDNGRVITDGVDTETLNYYVFGYLEDINNTSTNAKVILFYDYIPPIEGSNNITVKFPCYVEGNADLINKCHFGIMFGNNNAKNRLFLSGNPDYPNCDWHSGEVDSESVDYEDLLNRNYGYFEDLSVCTYGEKDNSVIGYDIVSNDKLLVLKDYSDKETTVYFRQPQLVTAINGSGTAVTGINDETLYQEEFSLVKGNNSVAGISHNSILNFNGDTVFLSNDKQLCGLDLTGIVGDNQRYANTRSAFIDADLANQDLDGASLWSNNKYMFLILKDKMYVTHYELKGETQYEWFLMDVPNVSSVLERNGVYYFGTTDGKLYKFTDGFRDIEKIFAGYNMVRLTANEDSELITATGYLGNLDEDETYYFRPIPFENITPNENAYLYYSLGTVLNDRTSDCDFFVQNGATNVNNVIELVCRRNGVINEELRAKYLNKISENVPVFLNKLDTSYNSIHCKSGSPLANAYGKKYYLREFPSTDTVLFQVYDENDSLVEIKDLYSARLCLRVDRALEMVIASAENGTFKLKEDGEILNIVKYNAQNMNNTFKGEIIKYSNVEAYYITKPYTMGNLEYLKTIWSFTLTNDSNIPSDLEICVANNKIPNEKLKTLAHISKDELGLDFSYFNFAKVDFDKNIVPRTYTHKRILSGVKFVCFGFRNYHDSNSILSSMTITYTLPYPSYGGD